jgi:hypothetical protein
MASSLSLSHRAVFTVGILDTIIIALIVPYYIYMKQTGQGLLILLIACLTIPLILYDVNCTFVGNCKIWGIVKTIALSLQAIATIIIVIMTIKNTKTKKSTESFNSPALNATNAIKKATNILTPPPV